MSRVPPETRLPTGVFAAFAALAVAASLAMRFTTPQTVSWGWWVALLVGFLVVPVIPTVVFVSMAARPRRDDAFLVLPNALLPLATAASIALPESMSGLATVLSLAALVLMAIAPVVAAVRNVEGTVYASLILSGLVAFLLTYIVTTRHPGWANDDGLGRAFSTFFMVAGAMVLVGQVLACAGIRVLVDRIRRKPAAW